MPGKSHGPQSLVGYRPWGCKELDTTEQLHFHFPEAEPETRTPMQILFAETLVGVGSEQRKGSPIGCITWEVPLWAAAAQPPGSPGNKPRTCASAIPSEGWAWKLRSLSTNAISHRLGCHFSVGLAWCAGEQSRLWWSKKVLGGKCWRRKQTLS